MPFKAEKTKQFAASARFLYWLRARILLQLGSLAPWVAVLLACVGIFLLTERHGVVGVLALLLSLPVGWLGGLWVLPRSGEAYARRVLRILQKSVTQASRVNKEQARRLIKIRKEIEALKSTQTLADLHGSVIEILRTLDTLGESSAKLEERSSVAMEKRMVLQSLIATLDWDRDGFAMRLHDRVSCRIDVGHETGKLIQPLIDRIYIKLQKIYVPIEWGESHKGFLKVIKGYRGALAVYYGTTGSDDIEATRAAARSLTERKLEMETWRRMYRAQPPEGIIYARDSVSKAHSALPGQQHS
jgi:hypothetical protein